MKHNLPETYTEAAKQCSLLGVKLSKESFEKISDFMGLLERSSARTNLIGPDEVPRLWTRHVLESLAFVPFLDVNREVIDVGTGAGFPGLVLSLCGYSVVLIESRRKRCAFLEIVSRHCGVKNRIVNSRVEETGPFPAGSVFTSRAVKKPAKMVKLISPAAPDGFTLVTRVSSKEETCSNTIISKELPFPPLDRKGFILQYRHLDIRNKIER